MSNNNIQASVIVPMKNAEDFIEKTIQNILLQENISYEIIVVNDQSTDRSLQIVEDFNNPIIKIVEGKGTGIADALNAGYSAAQGDILIRCDADDYLTPQNRLKQQYELIKSSSYEAICGNFSGISEDEIELGSFNCGDSIKDITDDLKKNITKSHFCSYAITKALFNKSGGFRSYFVTAEDVDFQLRLTKHTNIMYYPQNWYIYRLHSHSITHTQSEETKLKYEQQAKRFQQQRLTTGKDDLDLGIAEIIHDNPNTDATDAEKHSWGILISHCWRLHNDNNKKEACKLISKALAKRPFNLTLIKHFIMLNLKKIP